MCAHFPNRFLAFVHVLRLVRGECPCCLSVRVQLNTLQKSCSMLLTMLAQFWCYTEVPTSKLRKSVAIACHTKNASAWGILVMNAQNVVRGRLQKPAIR